MDIKTKKTKTKIFKDVQEELVNGSLFVNKIHDIKDFKNKKKIKMNIFIEALQILLNYNSPVYPISNDKGKLTLFGVDPALLNKKDIQKLKEIDCNTRIKHEYGGVYIFNYD